MLASFPANMVNHDSHPLENPSNRFCLFGTRSKAHGDPDELAGRSLISHPRFPF
jgi:hypothetical protein